MSAAVPCIGALIAARSAACRRMPLELLISGSHSLRPNTVSTQPVSLAVSLVSLHIFGDARIAREITVHVCPGGGALNAELRGQTELGHAIDQAEVDDFCIATLFAAHHFRRDAEHFRRSGAMYVLARGEGFAATPASCEICAMMRSSICE